MARLMVKLIIFDLDGTLVDAYTAVQKSLNFTLRKLGYPAVGLTAVKRSVGWGDKNFLKRFVRPKDSKDALAIYRAHHSPSLLRYSRVKPHALRILAALKKRGCRLAIASNRPVKFSSLLLRHLGLRKYFDLVVCAENRGDIKPKPRLLLKALRRFKVDRADALYVGDMVIDMRAGRNAGIRTVAVTGGSSSRRELERTRPFRIVSRLPDVLSLAQEAQ